MLIKLIFTHMTDPFLSFIYSKCQNPFHFVVYCAYYDFSYSITMNKTQSFILQITNSQNCDQYGAADAIFTTDKTWVKKVPCFI